MTTPNKMIRGYHPSLVFLANGLLSGYTNAAGAGTFDASASFDGMRRAATNKRIDIIRLFQMVDGGGGTTTVEVFRRRSGVNTLLGSVSLASGGGAFATATVTPASEALRELQVGDLVVVHFVARQTTTAEHVTILVDFT